MITRADFVADYRVSADGDSVKKINEIIEAYEPEILRNLLGNQMYTEFKLLTPFGGNDTPTPEQGYIIDAFDYFGDGCDISSEGMKVMLARMIYLYIARDAMIQNTALGDRINVSEVSIGIDNTKARLNYNKGVDTFRAIQNYCVRNSDIYTTFNGKCIGYMGLF